MKVNVNYSSRFRILKGGKVSLVDDSKYKGVAKLLAFFTNLAIRRGGDEFKGLEYNKASMTIDTFIGMPKPFEKKPFAQTGMKAGMRARLESLPDNISLEAPEYPEHVLKISDMQTDQVMPPQKEVMDRVERIVKLIEDIEQRENKVKKIKRDSSNIFGFTRANLIKMLTEQILENQN